MTTVDARDVLTLGQPVLLLGANSGVGGPELVVAAQLVSPGAMAFVVRYTCGFVTVALPAERCDDLDLPAVGSPVRRGGMPARPILGVAVDAAIGVSTGISAADRSRTARLLADAGTVVDDFTRPGHLVPVRVDAMDVTSAPAAGLALCRAAGLTAAAVRCELVGARGDLMTESEAYEFATEKGLAVAHVKDLVPAVAA